MTNTSRPTAAQKLARLQAESAKSGPCCSLWSRGVDCMCADAAELDAAFAENDDIDPVTLAANPVHLYDRSTAQVLLVLGSDTPAALLGIHGVRVLRLGDGEERWYSRATLEQGDRFVALCRHAYTLNDSCPGCDADDELLSTTPEVTADDAVVEKLRHTVAVFADIDPEQWAVIATSFSATRHDGRREHTATGLTHGDLRSLLALIDRR